MSAYNLVNPSDDIQFEAPDDAVAEAVATYISPMCGWETIDVEPQRCGGFLGMQGMGKSEDEAKAILAPVLAVLEGRPLEVATALESCEIQGAKRRRLGVDKDVWHDEHRTSVNDMCSFAWRAAEGFRLRAAEA